MKDLQKLSKHPNQKNSTNQNDKFGECPRSPVRRLCTSSAGDTGLISIRELRYHMPWVPKSNGIKDKFEGIFNSSMPSSQAQQSEVEAAYSQFYFGKGRKSMALNCNILVCPKADQQSGFCITYLSAANNGGDSLKVRMEASKPPGRLQTLGEQQGDGSPAMSGDKKTRAEEFDRMFNALRKIRCRGVRL